MRFSSSTSCVTISGATLWSILLLLLVLLPTSIQAKQFNPSNYQENIIKCDVPLYQNTSNLWEPSDDMCSDTTPTATLDNDNLLDPTNEATLHALAVAHAPYLFFHPLENFTMSSVNRTMGEPSEGSIYLNDFTGLTEFDDALTPESLIRSTRDFDYVLRSGNFFFRHDLTEDYVNGDGFDEDGVSNAPIYYRAFDSGNGTITINYYMYYTFNGPTNLGLLSSINGTEQYVRFMLPPWQVHEGGWKTMGVTICNAATPSQPLALTYRHHSFTQRLDCTAPDDPCTFFGNSQTHPVGFVALNSHYVHPFSAVELIYAEAPIEFWVNLQGILLVERTAYADSEGQNQRYYEPTLTNVLRLPEQDDIPENTPEELWWAAFGGAWGGTLENTSGLVSDVPLCLTNDTMDLTECPDREENYVFIAVMETLGVYPATTTFTNVASLVADFLNDMFAASTASPPSPAAMGIYGQLDGVSNAPIWDKLEEGDTGPAYCRRLVDEIPDTTRLPYDGEIIPLVKNVVGVILLGVVLILAAIVYFCCLKVKKTRPLLQKDEDGHFLQPKLSTRLWMFRTVTILSVAYSVCLSGAILFFIGYDKLIVLLEDTFPFLDFSSIKSLFFVLCVFVTIINSAVLIMAWFRADDLWNLLNEVYFDMVNDKEGVQAFMRRQWIKYTHQKVHTAFLICFASLLMSLIFSIFMVIIGIFSVGFAYAFGYACEELATSLDGVCLSFEVFGMREIQCGADFEAFCKEWAATEIVLTLWGAFIVTFGHFFLIACAGMILTQERETKRAIALLPNKEEYAEGFRVATNSRKFSQRVDESNRELMVQDNHELSLSENNLNSPSSVALNLPPNEGEEAEMVDDTPVVDVGNVER